MSEEFKTLVEEKDKETNGVLCALSVKSEKLTAEMNQLTKLVAEGDLVKNKLRGEHADLKQTSQNDILRMHNRVHSLESQLAALHEAKCGESDQVTKEMLNALHDKYAAEGDLMERKLSDLQVEQADLKKTFQDNSSRLRNALESQFIELSALKDDSAELKETQRLFSTKDELNTLRGWFHSQHSAVWGRICALQSKLAR